MFRKFTVQRVSPHFWIETLSLTYLAFPVILFLFGWTILPVAVICTTALLYAITIYIIRIKPARAFSFSEHRKTLVLAALLITFWVVLSGVGWGNRQSTDYNKHNAVMADLVKHDWPVIYTIEGQHKPLVYYVAYYLPSAALGKIVNSVSVAEKSLLPWTVVGMILAFYWFIRLCRQPRIWLALLFIFFGGMDVIGQTLTGTAQATIPFINVYALIEGYAGLIGVNYQANTTILYWAPQHAIAGWIIAGMLISFIVEKRSELSAILLLGLGLLWTPLVMIGMLPLLITYMLQPNNLRRFFDIHYLIPVGLFCLPVCLYLISAGSNHLVSSFLIFGSGSIIQKFIIYAVFVTLEFGVIAILLRQWLKRTKDVTWKRLLTVCIIFLCVLPFVRYGILNDLSMRASIPSLFVITILIARYFISLPSKISPLDFRVATLLVAILSLGGISALMELNVHVRGNSVNSHFWPSIASNDLSPGDKIFAKQYQGNDQSYFFKIVAK